MPINIGSVIKKTTIISILIISENMLKKDWLRVQSSQPKYSSHFRILTVINTQIQIKTIIVVNLRIKPTGLNIAKPLTDMYLIIGA